jgi:prevent-host-death family protein
MKHMIEVGIRALKQNASSVVAHAAAGETVTITDRGRPVAQMTPIPSSPLQSLLAAGRGRAARRAITTLTPPGSGAPLTRELAALREAERY